MQEEQEKQETNPEIYYTIKQASGQIRVAESTVWRWVDRGVLPAYRLPGRRIRLKKEDVDNIMRPTIVTGAAREDWRKWVIAESGAGQDLANLKRDVEAFRSEVLSRRGGKLLPSSVDDLRKARNEWGRRLDS